MGNRYEIDWDLYAKTAAQAAAEGAVLLKNDRNALPLKKGEKLSVFGRIQFDYYKSGTGSGGMINTRYVVGILDALKEEDLVLNKELEEIYRAWIADHPFDLGKGWAKEPWSQQEMPLDRETVKRASAVSDAALVVIGRTAGEDRDAENKAGSYFLSREEEEMLEKVCGIFERVIVVLNVGNVIDMQWVKTYDPQAVLYVWQGGMEGGHGAAEVLMGRMSPCGKLADTIALSVEDYPSAANFGSPAGDRYEEDIYVGYRYFETFEAAKNKVLYPFGFGLSYTSFALQSRMEERQDSCIFYVRVKNTGAVAGKEVVQIYAAAPQGKLGKPARALAAFGKTKCLAPGEVQEMKLAVTKRDLSSYDDSGATGYPFCYVLEAGCYRFYVGTDVRSAAFVCGMEIKTTEVVERCMSALAPVEAFERMRPVVSGAAEPMQAVSTPGKAGDAESRSTVQSETAGIMPTVSMQDKSEMETHIGSETVKYAVSRECVPLRTYSMAQRSGEEKKQEIPYTGDKGYKLGDVYDGAVSLTDFIGQLSDQDLCCIVRGEGMCSPKVTPGTAAAFGGVTKSLEGFGIPCGCCSDGPSGIRMDCGTYAFCLPNGTCLACTFNEELLERLYAFEGAELRKNRIDILLGPGMNIHRHPLNGRNFEYFSEDPLLTGKMAAAELRGLSGYQVTGAIKHFAANNQEYHRRLCNSVVSERALREIYLRGYEIAVKEAGAYAVMTTYGAINGLWTAGNYDLLTVILRQEWGFDGLVMTDWWADINEEGGPASTKNTAAMVRSQNDVYMVTQDAEKNTNGDDLEQSLKDGTLKRADLQRCAANILKVLMRSPVMGRSLGRMEKEELEAVQKMAQEDQVEFDIRWYTVGEKLKLDSGDIDTKKGSSFVCGLQTEGLHSYKICIRAKVDASELAQVPLSIFVNGTLKKTFTLNGTDGKYVELEQSLGEFMNSNNYLKLYFAESGMQIDKIWIEREN